MTQSPDPDPVSLCPVPVPARANGAGRTLWAIARRYPLRLAATFSLVALENILFLAYPLLAGFAVDAILKGDGSTAVTYALIVFSFWFVGAIRRAVDTRAFTRMYADLAVSVIVSQRASNQDTSTSAARVVLAREFIDFFERHVPMIATALVSMVGAVGMLLFISPAIGAACLVALVICLLFLPRFAARNEELHGRLNNRLEREIHMVGRMGTGTLRRHYDLLSKLRVTLSDREAYAFTTIGFVAALLFGFSILHLSRGEVQAGHVYSVMTYLWTFVSSLDEAPGVVDQLARLRDIGNRVTSDQRPAANDGRDGERAFQKTD